MKNLSHLLTFYLLANIATAAEPIRLPKGGRNVIQFGQGPTTRLIGAKKIVRGRWVAQKGMPFQTAFRAEIPDRTEVAWDAQLVMPIQRAFNKNNVMLLSFWVRCTKSEDERGFGTAAVHVQSSRDGPRFGFRFSANQRWQQWVRPFLAPADYDPKQSNITFHLSAVAQTLVIADLQLLDYGPDYDLESLPRSTVSYEGRKANATWREHALARIEKIRKGDLSVEVVSGDDKPIPDAKVRMRMRRHHFVFGSAVNVMLLAGEKADFPVKRYRKNLRPSRSSWDDAQKYRAIVDRYFTRVTFEGALRPHVWKLETGNHQRSQRQYEVLTRHAIPWLKARDISIRGHYIGWGAMDNTPLQRDFVGDPAGHRDWLWTHMADILPESADYVSEWDTINHIVGWGKTYASEYGGLQIHADIIGEARRLAPGAIHAINEGQILPGGERRKPYQDVIRFLKENGEAPDVVGFMAHFGSSSLTPPAKVLEVYDQFAEIAPRLPPTELMLTPMGMTSCKRITCAMF